MLAEFTRRWRTSSSRPQSPRTRCSGRLRWGAVDLQVQLPDGRSELELPLVRSTIAEERSLMEHWLDLRNWTVREG